MYPADCSDQTIVNKDRRGELFYYTNQQLIGRYNCERLSNKIYRVQRLNDLTKPIPEGYFSKLDNQLSSDNWPPRFANSMLKDICRPEDGLQMDLSTLKLWEERIKDAIDNEYVLDENGKKVSLEGPTGIDCLGNIIQSTILSPNRQFYGSLCDIGHMFLAYCHDPNGKHLEPHGVLGDYATTLRDPLFYRWHAQIDGILQLHKINLPPYRNDELNCSGITITSVDTEFTSTEAGVIQNELQTFWQQSDMDMQRGLDFSKNTSIYARITHLNHHPFVYKIRIKNDSSAKRYGTIRIFMAPKFDERSVEFTFEEQRRLMIELDRFKLVVNPGANIITRKSEDSSVTMKFQNMFNDGLASVNTTNNKSESDMFFNGCGYPQHLLIPKGHEHGITFSLFVMMSDIQGDRVESFKQK